MKEQSASYHRGEISDEREGDRKMQRFLLFVGSEEGDQRVLFVLQNWIFPKEIQPEDKRLHSIQWPNTEAVRFNGSTAKHMILITDSLAKDRKSDPTLDPDYIA